MALLIACGVEALLIAGFAILYFTERADNIGLRNACKQMHDVTAELYRRAKGGKREVRSAGRPQ